MTIPWPKDLPLNNRNLKVYGRLVKKLNSKFKDAKDVDDEQLKWEGYK